VPAVLAWSQLRPQAVPLPDVRGQPVQTAVRLLRDGGFTDLHLAPRADSRQGFVAAQDPDPGTRASTDRAVTLTVVGPSPHVRVPAVRGLAPRPAEARLRAADLDVAPGTTWQHDRRVAAGRVLGTSPAAGTVLEAGRPIQLVVSLGPELDSR
jgi:serine/threonine-protein kinase